MPTPIDRDQLQCLLADEHAQLVEVLPEAEFEDEHLPEAINIPLKRLNLESVHELERAASRLETLGFEWVYDYVAGKADWGSAGLPLEGANGSETRAGAHVRTEVPTCRPEDRLQRVCEQLEASGWDTCFVVDARGVVLGRLGRRAIRGRANVAAEEAMTPGPSTIRPSARLETLVERMQRQNLSNLPVTTHRMAGSSVC